MPEGYACIFTTGSKEGALNAYEARIWKKEKEIMYIS